MKIKYILTMCFFFTLAFIQAQKLSKHQFTSRYTYVFRLDSSQSRKVLQGIRRDSSLYLTNKVDSFFTDSAYAYDKLGWGFYYVVSVRAATVHYKHIHNEPFIKEIWGINDRNFVTLKDRRRHIIHDAKVTLVDGTECPFIKGMGAYEIPVKKGAVMLKMQYMDRWDYLFVNPEYVQAHKPKNAYPEYTYTSIAPGYLVFNQPKFKFHDTLKFKAFLLQDNAKPYKEKLNIYLSLDGKDKWIGSYKPQTPGAYFGQFEISDTLLVDRNYLLVFRNQQNEVVKSNAFYVENYELKPNRYTLQGPPVNCLVGDKVELNIGAFDANNLPVMDALIRVDLRIREIPRYLRDRQFIPDKWLHENYYHLEVSSDPSGNTSIVFPDSLFHNFDGRYEVVINITDQENNTKNMQAYFNYNNLLYAYKMQYQFDSLHVSSYFKAQLQSQDLVLETTYHDTIVKKVITTPYTQPIDFYAKQFRLYLGDSLLLQMEANTDYASMVYFEGSRSADSIRIHLVNPVRLPVYYEIYRDRLKVGEGYGETMDYTAADMTQSSYHVIWGYNQYGEFRNSFRVKSFYLYETRLNVLIKQPAEIYPGQKTDISIQVTDQHQQGVPNVNLTAYAVNMQFDPIPLPDVPYMGLTRGAYPLNTLRPMGYLPEFSHSCVLKKYHFDVFHLYGNEMYALLYAKGGKGVVQIPVKRRSPEVSVYVYQQHQLQNIVYIKIDSQLVYHQYYMPPSAFSFPLAKGLHTISIRTFDRLLTFDKLQVKDSIKYVLGFNLDSLAYVADTFKYEKGKLKAYEKNEFLDHALFLKMHDWQDTFRLFQDRKVKIFSRRGTFYSTASMRIEKDNYIPVGPVAQGRVKLVLDRDYEHEFNFSRGYAYLLLKDEIKKIPVKDDLRQYAFLNNQVMHYGIYNVGSFDALSYAPEYDTVPVNMPMKEPVQEEEVEEQDRTRPAIEEAVYAPKDVAERPKGRIRFVFSGDILFNKSWLINTSDKKLSSINHHERDLIEYYGSHLHDLILFTDSSFAVYKNLQLTTGGTFVLFVKPEHFKPLELEQIYNYDEVIADLIRHPLRDFSDTPIIIKPVVILKKAYKSKYARITGTVMDARFKTPVDYADIYMEIEGYFKAGATTNADGKFMVDSLPPGNYMLKIRSSDYRYHIIYKLVLEKGKEIVINIGLIHQDDRIYYTADGEVVLSRVEEARSVDKDDIEYEVVSRSNTMSSSYTTETKKMGVRAMAGYSTYASGVSGRGSRSDGTAIYVDGVRVNNSAMKDAREENVYINRGYATTSEEDMQGRMESMSLITQANRIRDHFRDYGYWVPNLITDAQGMAHFTVTFPDNITSWKTMVPAMNGLRQSGMATMVTRSFKPLYSLMATPFFLTEGDRIVLKGRILNYTGKEQQVKIRFTLNDSLVKSHSAGIGHVLSDTFSVRVAKGADTLKSAFMFDMANGYTDGEERKIPVRINGILISESRQILLKTDTVLRIGISPNAVSAKILVQNSEAERLLEEIERLKNYSYGCVEQTASKLRALLGEKAMREALGLPFTQDKFVRKMIHKLNTTKNSYGTWSWWGGSGEEDWLSSYVMKTLNQARLAGYSNNVYVSAAKRLEQKLPGMSVESRLYALNALWDMDRDVRYDSFIKYIPVKELNDQQKLLYLRLRQKTGKAYDISEVTRLLRHSETGGIYFGEPVMRYHSDISSTTLIAYDILSHNDSGSEYLPYIRDFMYSSEYPQHTFALAELISMGTGELLRKKKAGVKITGNVTVNGYLIKPTDYPFRNRLMPGDTVTIKHDGPEAFATIVTSRMETSPRIDDTYFSIKTSLAGQWDNTQLSQGQAVDMVVSVDVYKDAEHVMMEIPVPAGFSYAEKPPAMGVETYREYFYDKTSIFCSHLPVGHYTFRIRVIPKFSGTFNLPPAKIELMYYPEIHNNEKTKVVEVR